MKATPCACERRFYEDEKTGASVTQLTSYPVNNTKLYMHVDQFYADSSRLLFYGERYLGRGAPCDIYSIGTDGTDMQRITGEGDPSGGACVDPGGKYLFTVGGELLYRTDLYTLETLPVARCEGFSGGGLSTVSEDLRYYVTEGSFKGSPAVYAFDTAAGTGRAIYVASEQGHSSITHVQLDQSGSGYVAFQHDWMFGERKSTCEISAVKLDGSDLLRNCVDKSNGHWAWLGRTGKIVTNRLDDHNYMSVGDIYSGELTDIVHAPGIRFWHGGSSNDGTKVISDTNWPNLGLYVIDVATGEYRNVCLTKNYAGHAQRSHAHPSFSPDMKYAAFQSDATGTTQVYLAKL